MKHRIFILCVATVFACVLDPGVSVAVTRYVDVGQVTGSHDGTSWGNAYSNLQNAVTASSSPTDLWVAEGTYSPGTLVGDYFNMKAGVNVYGGFTNGMTTFGERDWAAHETILDGGQVNSHVVRCYAPITFDGLIVQNGRNDASYVNGAGWWGGSTPTIRNCTFRYNLIPGGFDAKGAGMYLDGGSQWIENCLFTANTNASTGLWQGGGAIFLSSAQPTITNCTFVGNTSARGGAGLFSYWCNALVVDCTFRDNVCSPNGPYGGAIGHYRQSSPIWTIRGCTFIGNTAPHGAAIGHVGAGTFTIDNCTFASNSATSGNGGAVVLGDQSASDTTVASIRNSRFVGNAAPGGFAAVYLPLNVLSTGRVENCGFYGNRNLYTGGLAWGLYGTGSVANCVFVGNDGFERGGGMNCIHGLMTIGNCTVYGNYAKNGGGILNRYSGQADLVISNSIVWGNAGNAGEENIANYIAGPVIKYTAIEGGMGGIGGDTAMTDGGGIVTSDPQLALNAENGNWNLAGSYDPVAGKTTLADTDKSWTSGAFTGMSISPDKNNSHSRNKWLQFLICTNDATTITTWGDCSWLATNNAPYQVNDWHLKSTYGRFTPLGKVQDGVHSPCIDAGDASDYSQELFPNGGRINLGAFGNTEFTSLSVPDGTMFLLR